MKEYVEAYLSIEKSEQYKDLILKFLRSFCSTVKVNQIDNTHYKYLFIKIKKFNQKLLNFII